MLKNETSMNQPLFYFEKLSDRFIAFVLTSGVLITCLFFSQPGFLEEKPLVSIAQMVIFFVVFVMWWKSFKYLITSSTVVFWKPDKPEEKTIINLSDEFIDYYNKKHFNNQACYYSKHKTWYLSTGNQPEVYVLEINKVPYMIGFADNVEGMIVRYKSVRHFYTFDKDQKCFVSKDEFTASLLKVAGTKLDLKNKG